MTDKNLTGSFNANAKKYAAMFFKTAGFATVIGGSLAASIMVAGTPAGVVASVAAAACGTLFGAVPMEFADRGTKKTMAAMFLGAAAVGGFIGGALSGDAWGGAILAPAAIAASTGLGFAIMSPAERLAPDLDKFQRPALPLEKAFKTAVAATVLGGIAFGAYTYKQDTLALVDHVRAGISSAHLPVLSK